MEASNDTSRFLPLEQHEKFSIKNGTSVTSFYSRGITLTEPKVEDESENSSDRGVRLTIHSSHGARNSNFGEGVRMIVDTPQSKNMIAWYDGFSRNGKITTKAWIGYHHGTYPDVVHDHISIETPNEMGALHTRFGISTKRSEVANVDFNMSDVQLTASQGGTLRLAVGGGKQTKFPRDLVFATGIDHGARSRRWAIRADITAEAGENAGSLLRLMRYSDSGDESSESTMVAHRGNGHIGFGIEPSRTWRINIDCKSAGIRISGGDSSNVSLVRLEGAEATSRILSARKPDDSRDRFSLSVAGWIEWGAGNKKPDVNLRRTLVKDEAALVTNAEIYSENASRGPVVRSANGELFRLRVDGDGNVFSERI